MLFVKNDELKEGMRLAKPIYNKNGVLLYEKNTKLTEQGISSIMNFGLIGIYILEPAEPLPPMSDDDIEFERFQTMSVFMLKEGLDLVIKGKANNKISMLSNNIIKKYGNLNRRSTFIQNLRCKDDYTYKHSLNSAILSALISNKMKLTISEKNDVVLAALYQDIGRLLIPPNIINKGMNITDDEKEIIKKCELEGFSLLNYDTSLSQGTKSIIMSLHKEKNNSVYSGVKVIKSTIVGSKILKAASDFDKLTAMSIEKGPSSEIEAIHLMLSDNDKYDETIVKALLDSIKFLVVGTSVELTNGKKGIVLVENNDDVLRPIVLEFESNKMLNFNDSNVYKEVQIKDIMKTMDNRYVIDRETIKKYFNNNLT